METASPERVAQLVPLLRDLKSSHLRGTGNWFELANIRVGVDGRSDRCIHLRTQRSYGGRVEAKIEQPPFDKSRPPAIYRSFDGTELLRWADSVESDGIPARPHCPIRWPVPPPEIRAAVGKVLAGSPGRDRAVR